MKNRNEINTPIRMPWHITCNIACRAMMAGTDFERMTEQMLRECLAITNTVYENAALYQRSNRRNDFKAKQAARA